MDTSNEPSLKYYSGQYVPLDGSFTGLVFSYDCVLLEVSLYSGQVFLQCIVPR